MSSEKLQPAADENRYRPTTKLRELAESCSIGRRRLVGAKGAKDTTSKLTDITQLGS